MKKYNFKVMFFNNDTCKCRNIFTVRVASDYVQAWHAAVDEAAKYCRENEEVLDIFIMRTDDIF